MNHHHAHGLGRCPVKDPRDQAHLLRVAPPVTPRSKSWPLITPVLNQGDTPMCVGYSWTQFLFIAPVEHKANALGDPSTFASTLYNQAKTLDEFSGTNYDGTSVRAGAKALTKQGRLSGYEWAFDALTARNYVLSRGPLIFGINWYNDMFAPKKDGTLSVTGDVAGGHAILCGGYSVERNAFRLINSWGDDWGQSGRAWLGFADADRLIQAEDGECCSAVERKLP